MAAPARVPLTIVRGDDETVVVTITTDGTTAVNITGRTYVASFAVTPGATVVTTGSCAVTGASGIVTITISDTNTDLLTGSSYWWDLVETSGTSESTLILGPVTVIDGVTL